MEVHAEDVADSVLLSLDGEGRGIDDLCVPLIRNPGFRNWKGKKKKKTRVSESENGRNRISDYWKDR